MTAQHPQSQGPLSREPVEVEAHLLALVEQVEAEQARVPQQQEAEQLTLDQAEAEQPQALLVQVAQEL